MIRVLFFGSLRDAAGNSEITCEPPPSVETVSALGAWLARDNPQLSLNLAKPGLRVARDQLFCGFDAPLNGAAEVAFMSPLSGG